MFFAVSCGKKKAEAISAPEPVKEMKKTYEIAEIETAMNMSDCLQEYADLEQLLNKDGEIVIVVNQSMISFDGSRRVHPCNLPDGYEEGQQVTFSGFIKEAPKGVRLAGTPFKLTSIVRR